MNTATVAALRRLGLALAIGGIAAGGAFTAASAQVGATGTDDSAAAQSAPAAGAPDMPPDGPQGKHRGFGGPHGGPGFGPGGPRGWHHNGPMGQHRGFRGHHHGMMMDRGFLAALRELKLTPVQREQMRTIMFNAREAVRMEHANAQQSGAAEHRREDFAVLSNPGDPNYARAVQQLKSRITDRVQQAVTRASETEQKLYNVLTAEQKAQLPKALSDLQARRQQRMQAMRMHRQRRSSGANASENAPPPPAPQ